MLSSFAFSSSIDFKRFTALLDATIFYDEMSPENRAGFDSFLQRHLPKVTEGFAVYIEADVTQKNKLLFEAAKSANYPNERNGSRHQPR